ncbi:MAG: AraC family transcriptional regulator [Paenibacillaceae bacterium]|jgi:AraC-like DNA-binding protein|nr:AraC family transcriptional regulator [Paenibacillaceae bacterium]
MFEPNMEAVKYDNPLLPVSLEHLQQDKGWHCHANSEWIMVRKGEVQVDFDATTLSLSQGQVALIALSQPHRIRLLAPGTCYVSLRFDLPAFLESNSAAYLPHFERDSRACDSINTLFIDHPEACREAAVYMEEICREISAQSACYELAVSMHIKQMLLLLIRNQAPGQMTEYCGSMERLRIKPVLDYIEAHLDDRISVEEVCGLVHMSYNYFIKFFKKETGQTFLQYVHNQKIKRAAHLLLTSNISVSEVCGRISIENMAHFYKLFKRINGCSPKQFQCRMRKQETVIC